jgi:hypothetical protein
MKKCEKCRKNEVNPPKRVCEECKTAVCLNCGKKFKKTRGNVNKYCSRVCKNTSKEQRENSSKTMTKTNLKYRDVISERMKKHNPGSDPKVQAKAKATKRINGTLEWKKNRGGNGRDTPIPQKILLTALGYPWTNELAIKNAPENIPNGLKKQYCMDRNLPTCYKIDIGPRRLKIGIEIDGGSHLWKERKKLDKKKERYLKKLGWKVLRFTNQEVMTNLSKVLSEIKKEIKAL